MRTLFIILLLVQSAVAASIHIGTLSVGPAPPPPTNPQETYLIVGQSLATGGGLDNTALLTNATTRGVGVGFPIATAGPSTDYDRNNRTPLVETNKETGWRAFADELTALTDGESMGTVHDPMILDWALGGTAYNNLKKGGAYVYFRGAVETNNYWFSMRDLTNQAAYQLANVGNGLKFPAIISVHGEADQSAAAYTNYMVEWQADYQADIQAVTGTTNTIPMFHSQTIDHGYPTDSLDKPRSSLAMLWLHEQFPDTQVLVGPKYFMPAHDDGVHLTNHSYQIMGEYYARAVFQKVIMGQIYEPLRPTNVVRVDDTITLTMSKASLVFDTNNVTDPGDYGFTYTDSSSPPAISSVVLAGATTNQVVITLASIPAGTSRLIRYGLNSTGVSTGGPTTGPRGCLRDQDTAVGVVSGTNLWNWCVMFEKSCD